MDDTENDVGDNVGWSLFVQNSRESIAMEIEETLKRDLSSLQEKRLGSVKALISAPSSQIMSGRGDGTGKGRLRKEYCKTMTWGRNCYPLPSLLCI